MQLNTFTFEGASVRTLDIDGAPWFVAKDVAERLGYTWAGVATVKHIPEDWRGVNSVQTPSGAQEMTLLSEQGLYFFLARSDKPAALPFQRWIAGDVMPALRRTGAYAMHGAQPFKVPETLGEALRLAADLSDQVHAKNCQIADLTGGRWSGPRRRWCRPRGNSVLGGSSAGPRPCLRPRSSPSRTRPH